ncbi:MAG: diaminopimelate epimerase [Candidatus Caldatribacteriota bacterium]
MQGEKNRVKFYKYHGLGNDYIVIDPSETDLILTQEAIKLICHRNYGVGSDGILYGPEIIDNKFGLRIFNPDGSEAEKSGNGLRIFSRYLWDKGLVKDNEFTINTIGGAVKSQVLNNGKSVKVEMGQVSFEAKKIPVNEETGEVIKKKLIVDGKQFIFSAVTIGNPHCVIIADEISPEETKKYGPLIEKNPKFANRTNVQFMKIIDESNIQIEIWERGAGYTLASGSSSVAAAAVAFKLKLCKNNLTVRMQGGKLKINITDNFFVTMTGPVVAVYEGELKGEMIEKLKTKF